MGRLRQKKSNMNGIMNGSCPIPSSDNLNLLKTKLEAFTLGLTNSKQAVKVAINAGQAMSSWCGWGRSVSHWNTKYSAIKQAKLQYPQTSYCEPKYIVASIELLKIQIPALDKEVIRYLSLVSIEESLYAKAIQDYDNCVARESKLALDEAERLSQEAIKLEEEAGKITAEVELTGAETEQISVEQAGELEQMQQTQLAEESKRTDYMPFLLGGLALGGLYIYTRAPKKKSRR